jgi:Kef-type K+ transport system membrane component KefB
MRAQRVTVHLLSLAVLLGLAAFVLLSPVAASGVTGGQATFCLGFVLLFGYYAARLLRAIRLPAITSYILVGVICGPFMVDLLSTDVVASLQRLDDVALAIIALIAGGEMRWHRLKARAGAFARVIGWQLVCSFVGAVGIVFLLRDRLGGIAVTGGAQVLALGLLFTLVTVARSPATTIGVVTELRARGPLTEVVVGVTVLIDVVILTLAAIVLPAAETLFSGEPFSTGFARDLAVELFGSAAAGLFLGAFIQVYIRWVTGYLPLLLLGVGLLGSEICHHYHLSPLLAFMIAGFYVQNFSALGKRLIAGLERSAFPVYVLFFAISGASIDLGALRASWVLALALVAMRAAAFFVGSLAAARTVPDLRRWRKPLWSGFLAQAGVTIGIAALVARRFSWGAEFETIVLAVVAVNQLAGPVALKLLLERSGEVGGMDRDR